jgi:protein-S-isoprenylcysteine O-methyltransferase Ste14
MSTQPKVITPRVIVQVILFVVVIPFFPLLISRHWNWWEAWVYAAISILGFAISRALAARRNPGILAERAKFLEHENAESWDRLLSPLVGLGGGLIPVVVGLDALFGWSPEFSMMVKILSLFGILAGYAISSYALIENAFFSGMVRIQKDRGHRVVSSGPYRWVRHPGYAGALITYYATPLFLDSLWAFIPTIILTVILIIRTHLEDATLQERLEGYRDYAKRVRHRILPGIW